MEYKTAEQMRNENENLRKALKECKQRQMESIQRANERGHNKAPFDGTIRYKGRYYDFDDEIREWLEDLGYKVIPTGYIGGVWQLTEDVKW